MKVVVSENTKLKFYTLILPEVGCSGLGVMSSRAITEVYNNIADAS